jgi:hypothetical protein
MKLIVQYVINEEYFVEEEFIGEDEIALVTEAKNHPLYKQCTSATFDIIEEDDGAQ